MKTPSKSILGYSLKLLITLGVTVVTFDPLFAQRSISVEEFSYPESLSVKIDETGTSAEDRSYFLQYSETAGSGDDWVSVEGAQFAEQGGGQYVVTTGQPFMPGFYRVIGFFSTEAIVAEFSSSSFELKEGDDSGFVLIRFSAPFTGTLNYTVEGTAMPPDYAPLSGSIEVSSALEARIEIDVADNSEVGTIKFLNLILQSTEGFELGATSSTLVNFEENDSEWLGSLFEGELEACFNLISTENADTLAAVLSSEGDGIFPAGEFPVQLDISENQFSASVADIALSADELFYNSETILSISLAADASIEGQTVSDDYVQGIATLTTTVAALPHLNSVKTIEFYLNRKPTAIFTESQPLSDI